LEPIRALSRCIALLFGHSGAPARHSVCPKIYFSGCFVSSTVVEKRYDRAYFDRWYRNARTRIDTPEALVRKVRVAVSAAEYFLGRRITSVLDVGCGEGRWYSVLRRMRPGVRYTGVDSSEYVVRRFGRTRNVRLGTFGGLRKLRIGRHVDLIVCSDVLQYVGAADLDAGLREIRRLLAGVAYIEAFTIEDEMEGDRTGWHERSAAQYRRVFRRAGLTPCGLNCFVDLESLTGVNVFEVLSWR
jgi:SAM-dependent methyltransferase